MNDHLFNDREAVDSIIRAGRRSQADLTPHDVKLEIGSGSSKRVSCDPDALPMQQEQQLDGATAGSTSPKVRDEAMQTLLDDPNEFDRLMRIQENENDEAWTDESVGFHLSLDGSINTDTDGDPSW